MKKGTFQVLTVVPYVLLLQLEYYFQLNRYLVLLCLMFPLLFLRKKDFKLERSVIYSVILGVVFLFMLIEPGIVYGKTNISFSSFNGLANTLYPIIFTISLISMVHGVILKNTWKKPFLAIGFTAIIYILSVTPVKLFFNVSGLASLLLFNIAFLVVISYYVGFLYLKSNKNILSSMIFLIIYSLFLNLNINVEVSRYFNLVWEVISLSVLLFVTDLLLKESIRIKRAFKSKRIAFKKKDKSTPVIFAGVIIVFAFLVLMPMVTHESHYAIADPTDSMYPVIHPGSLLLVSHINTSQVKNGTIIVFNAPWDNGTLYAHQVISVTHLNGVTYYTTKGVNNPAKDPLPVPSNDVVGKVALAIPYLGYILIYSKVTVAVILVLIGVSYFKESRK